MMLLQWPAFVTRIGQVFNLDADQLIRKVVAVLVIWALAWAADQLVRLLARRIERTVDDGDARTMTMQEKQGRTVAQLLRSVGRLVIVSLALLVTLNQFINIGPILAGAGILGLAISFGAQSARVTEDVMNGTAENFPGTERPTLSNGSIRNVAESKFETVTAGGFLQNVLDWKDRYFVTLGLRVDGSSTFGSEFGLQTYPKASLSYIISDEPFWPANLGQVKLRAAYGHAGRQPGAFDATRTWTQVGYGGRPAFQTSNIGNPDLGPERTAETELGFDASLLGGRLTADFTYYHRKTTDALFRVLQPPSLGFPDPQLSNVGEMKSMEIVYTRVK